MIGLKLIDFLDTREKAKAYYSAVIELAMRNDKLFDALAKLIREDLFFLLVFGLRCWFADNEWFFARCREVQKSPNNHLDLWSREHGKSTIITFALTIFTVINNQELTICIFSFTQGMARKSFMAQIKRELEGNELLKGVFPTIFYENPKRESPRWSEEGGLIVKRIGNPREATIEAWGLTDGQPTSKHFDVIIYDDIVTRDSVTTPEMIAYTTEQWANSLNLGKTDPVTGDESTVRRYAGTYWALNDTYQIIEKRGAANVRKYPGGFVRKKEDGSDELITAGYFSQSTLLEKRERMGADIFGKQILLDPRYASSVGLDVGWLRYWDPSNLKNLNVYIIVDPSGEKAGKRSDYTSILVFAVDAARNHLVIDMIRDKIGLVKRTDYLFEFFATYFPMEIGYESYGKDSDLVYITDRQERENIRFDITVIGGKQEKNRRIELLVDPAKNGRIYLPHKECRKHRVNWRGDTVDMIQEFIDEEWGVWGSSATHDDGLDTLARSFDGSIEVKYPLFKPQEANKQQFAIFSRTR